MLVLTRLENETIVIFKDGGNYEDVVEVTLIRIEGNRVKLGFKAKPHMKIVRKELLIPESTHEN